MDHLPDPDLKKNFLSKMNEKEAKDNELFSARVDQEEAAACSCTCCPPRNQLEPYDYCCMSLFSLPLKRKGQLLRDGLKTKLKEEDCPCITLNTLFTSFLLSDTVSLY